MADTDLLFAVRTPLGFSVRVTKARWELITTIKHPVMNGREAIVKLALASPDEVRQSRSEATVFLFYKADGTRRWVCAVAKHAGDHAFLSNGLPN